jgi:hypothetical protein
MLTYMEDGLAFTANLEAEATPEDVDQVARVLREAGLSPTVEANVLRASVTDLPWIIYAAVGTTFGFFLKAMAEEAGKDAWVALKSLVGRLYEVRSRPGKRSGGIRVDAQDVTIVLTDTLPDEAYRQLSAGELPESTYLVWDADERKWRAF